MKISTATVAVWLAFAPVEPPAPAPTPAAKCCGKCNGTGWVLSGDGIAKVPCPCPATCPCKKPKAAAPVCTSGTCRLAR